MKLFISKLVLIAFLTNIFAPSIIFAVEADSGERLAVSEETVKKVKLDKNLNEAGKSAAVVNNNTQTRENSILDKDIRPPTQNADEPPPTTTPVYTPPKSTPQDPLDFLKGLSGTYQTDLFTGAATFSYPLSLPSGRLNMTPSLALNYSSLNTKLTSIFGYGWDLSTGTIYRSTSKGIDKLYSKNDFSAEIFGSGGELTVTDSSNGIYQAKTEGSFSKYIFSNNSWTAYDVSGTKYLFGSSDSTRQSNPSDTTKVYKWMLEKVEDTNGNSMTFTYYKENGQIYPDKIRYTNNGSETGIYEVQFIRTAAAKKISSYLTGFKVTTDYLIDRIDIYSYATGSALSVRSYDFDYASGNNSINKLSAITIKNGSLSYPATKFTYYGSGSISQNFGLLQKIEFPLGGIETFSYKKSTAYRTSSNGLSNKNLPFSIDTINKVTKQASASDSIYTYTYDYEGGHYYFDDADSYKKEYSGFHIVKMTDPKANFNKIFFHQSEFASDNGDSVNYGEYDDHIAKKGRIYRQEVYDSSGKLFQVSISKWDKKSLTSADSSKQRYFVFLARNTSIDYDGDTDYKTKVSENTYDDYGNVLSSIDYGEVTLNNQKGEFTDTSDDKMISTIEYGSNSSKYIFSFPKHKTLKDYYGTTYGETKIYYDNLTYGNLDKGNNTKNEILKNASSQYITNQISYNSYGLPLTITNFRNYPTTIVYDSLNLFPKTVTNAKNQVTTYTYNYLFGTPATVTDPNNLKSQNDFDDLGRITYSKITNPANTSQMKILKAYSYDNTVYPSIVTETDYPNNTDNNGANIEILSKTFADGYGRVIQIKKEAEGANYIVSSVVYDEIGNVKKELLPYFTTSINFETIDQNKNGNSYTYDVLSRPLSITNSVGTSTITYDQWMKTQTDSNSHKKDFLMNARGNLVRVTEYLDGNSYNTVYVYDPLNNLTRITDAKGNLRNMTYDFLGKMLTIEDLHTSNDTSFGTWTYEYDENGNLKKTTDPKAQVITYQYDELDRVLNEDFANTSDIDIEYVYDTGTNAVGKLYSVHTEKIYSNGPEGQISKYNTEKYFTYNILGQLISENDIIQGKSYTTGYEYDMFGDILKITYPDSMQVSYKYNNANLLEKVYKDSTTEVLKNLDYSPIGAVNKTQYANGVISDKTYDPNEVYRLKKIYTYKDSKKLQEIAYTFDPVGNIKTITDTSNTNSAKTASYSYDDLDRLKTATITNTANSQNYSHTYNYDILGNILNFPDISGSYVYAGGDSSTSSSVYANPNAVTTAGTTNYTYDNNGNLSSAGLFNHSWNFKNQLTKSTDGTKEVLYYYDEGGNRVMKAVKDLNNSQTKTVYINKFYNIDGIKLNRYIYAGNMKIETDTKYSVTTTSGYVTDRTVVFHHEDHLSGSNVDTDESGNVVELLDYYPYGKTRLEETAEGNQYCSDIYENDFKYTGKELDDETGLYYYGARYYDAQIGRFISLDPWSGDLSDPQSFNKYAYVRNNPLKYNDPTGEYWHLVAGAVGGLILGVLSQALDEQVDTTADYVSAAIGGAVTGTIFAANPFGAVGKGAQVLNSVISGAGGGGVTNIINQALSNHTIDTNEVLSETLKEGMIGAIPTPHIKVPGISSVAESIVTKLEKRIINNVSLKTETKMITNNVIQGIPGLGIETGLNSISNNLSSQQNNTMSPNIYTVQRGDSLSKVFGNDWKKVAEYNNLSNPNIIHPGDQLKVPGK